MSDGWDVVALHDDVDEAHVVPTDDVVGHDLDDRCVCGPRSEIVLRDGASDGWVIVHQALDGRP